jgi:hypothetical protein
MRLFYAATGRQATKKNRSLKAVLGPVELPLMRREHEKQHYKCEARDVCNSAVFKALFLSFRHISFRLAV